MAKPKGTPETKQAAATWTCKCPRELPVRIQFCKRCGASQ